MAKLNKKKNKNIPHMTIGIAAVVAAILLTLTVTDKIMPGNGDVVDDEVILPETEEEVVLTDTESGSTDEETTTTETGTTDDTSETDTDSTSETESEGTTNEDASDQTTEEEVVSGGEEPVEDAEQVCTPSETDEGIDLFERGKCTAADGIDKTDFCIDEEFIVEYNLVEEGCNGVCAGNTFKCQNGCEAGACMPEPEAPSCEYTDTDGGFDKFVAGICTGSDGVDYADECVAGDLKEYYDPGNFCDSACGGAIIECEFGCSEGACLPNPNEQCEDFCTAIPQKEPYTDGSCVFKHGQTAEITCSDAGYTYENPISRKCADTSYACCCEGGLVIQ